MNTMKKFFLMSGLLAISSTGFAAMNLVLDNEAATTLTVTFSQPLKNGKTSEDVNANSKETVEVGDAWLNADVKVTWSNGDADTVHFKNANEELRSSSDDEKDGEHADVLIH